MDRQVYLRDEEAFVPDEFSDGTQDDMEEFVENEENFEVRPSISSRGSMGRATRDRNNDNVRNNQLKGKCWFYHSLILEL